MHNLEMVDNATATASEPSAPDKTDDREVNEAEAMANRTPADWNVCISTDGVTYYWNKNTGETTFDKPEQSLDESEKYNVNGGEASASGMPLSSGMPSSSKTAADVAEEEGVDRGGHVPDDGGGISARSRRPEQILPPDDSQLSRTASAERVGRGSMLMVPGGEGVVDNTLRFSQGQGA